MHRSGGDNLEDDFDDKDVEKTENEEKNTKNNKRKNSEIENKEEQAKKKSRWKKLKEKKKLKYQEEKNNEKNILHLSAKNQAEMFWSKYCQHFSKILSSLEKSDSLNEKNFITFEKEDEHQLENLSNYLKTICPNWKKEFCEPKKEEERGVPRLLILTFSAIRATEIVKTLGEFRKLIKIGKLFAKHIKLEEQKQFLDNYPVRIVVGTPNRVGKLINWGTLNLDKCKLLLIDLSKNAKNQTIFDIKDTTIDFFDFYKQHCHHLIRNQKMKLCFY